MMSNDQNSEQLKATRLTLANKAAMKRLLNGLQRNVFTRSFGLSFGNTNAEKSRPFPHPKWKKRKRSDKIKIWAKGEDDETRFKE